MAEVTPQVNPLEILCEFGVYFDAKNKDLGKEKFKVRVVYESIEQAVECAAAFTAWKCQDIERNDRGTYPNIGTGKVQLVNHIGKFTLTKEERIQRESTEELGRLMAMMQAEIDARNDAKKVEELTEAELEAATAPNAPVQEPAKKARGRK